MARTSKRRQRESARRRAQAASAARRTASRRRQRIVAAVVAAVVVLAVAGTYIGATRATSPTPVTSTTAPSTTSTSSVVPATGVAPSAASAGESISGPTPCPAADGSSPRVTHFAEAPPTCIDPGSFYMATVTTTKGTMTFQLDPRRAPQTVNDVVVLADYHFYDGQPVTNVTTRTSFTIGLAFSGDATAPGFALPDEVPPRGQVFTTGTIAAAGAAGSPGTHQGQLLVATYEGAAGIDQGVTAFGLMLSGDDTLRAIDAVASQDGRPAEAVTISAVTVSRSSAIPG